MFDPSQYELLDFGSGRKLERFGTAILDRPAPAADRAFRQLPDWRHAEARFERPPEKEGRWVGRLSKDRQPWTIQHGNLTFELQMTDSGQLGLFPEQAANWDWVAKQVGKSDRPLKVLNLFAHTGATTLAAAAAGAETVHVEGAGSVLRWARRNAELSDLSGAAIRWINEDAVKFAQRECRRGNQYDAIILDPPSYGHGPKGEVWKLSRHLPRLLQTCAELVKDRLRFLLFTCHTPGYGPAELQAMLEDTFFGHCQTGASADELYLTTSDHRRLPAGVVARWPH